ncbi:MAG: hypothetical protein QOG83_1338 [Alphaproteobacteria bacterium]|nr:hypothetical protein [Alphaproteobacteria bacterium]
MIVPGVVHAANGTLRTVWLDRYWPDHRLPRERSSSWKASATDDRAPLKEASFRLVVTGIVGVKEIERLIKKLELDKEILADQENDQAAN